ncbi:MAG: hypothetical protein J5J06_00045 [Phycisphaerae bacterium]|nr:hypothetical protein [Phycisphaerae bacterium]
MKSDLCLHKSCPKPFKINCQESFSSRKQFESATLSNRANKIVENIEARSLRFKIRLKRRCDFACARQRRIPSAHGLCHRKALPVMARQPYVSLPSEKVRKRHQRFATPNKRLVRQPCVGEKADSFDASEFRHPIEPNGVTFCFRPRDAEVSMRRNAHVEPRLGKPHRDFLAQQTGDRQFRKIHRVVLFSISKQLAVSRSESAFGEEVDVAAPFKNLSDLAFIETNAIARDLGENVDATSGPSRHAELWNLKPHLTQEEGAKNRRERTRAAGRRDVGPPTSVGPLQDRSRFGKTKRELRDPFIVKFSGPGKLDDSVHRVRRCFLCELFNRLVKIHWIPSRGGDLGLLF